LKYIKQFRLYFDSYSYRTYDFYLPKQNLLIECDGDYWHGNPQIYTKLNEMQIFDQQNDKFKNELASMLSIKLLRIWESDVQQNFNLEKLINEKIQS